jgi:hypothetical protein
MKIERIEIRDFRGFPGSYEFKLGRPGQNLLVYGENGSGKSSLFQALRRFFAASEFTDDILAYRNEFTKSDEVEVKLDLAAYDEQGNRHPDSGIFEWNTAASPHGQALIQEANKTKGCLDYRSLLDIHYVHRDKARVEIFQLLEKTILGHAENPITKKAFGVELAEIRDMVRKDWRTWAEILDGKNRSFNQGFENVLGTVEQKTNLLLARFFPDTQVHLELDGKLARSGTGRNKGLAFPKVYLAATTFGLRREDLHHFLNEARLSAIAISIYLASLLIVPASRLRLLVLDDLLIGIDMSNRMAVLNILREEFNGWQIILLTHDRVWYEIVRMHTLHTKSWHCSSLRSKLDAEGKPTPWWKGFGDGWNTNLDIAKRHLDDDDIRAAGVYARAAFEEKLKRFCEDHHVPVRFASDLSALKSNDFWLAVLRWIKEKGREADFAVMASEVEAIRKLVLNPLSHEHPINLVRAEIEQGIEAVRHVDEKLRALFPKKPVAEGGADA